MGGPGFVLGIHQAANLTHAADPLLSSGCEMLAADCLFYRKERKELREGRSFFNRDPRLNSGFWSSLSQSFFAGFFFELSAFLAVKKS
ncbi:MAG TPA: hypothetical protein VIS74_04365, partial [Chthoniobacterales bacterium]